MANDRCMEEMRIGIIGSGVVGEATGKLFDYYGNHVVFNDIDKTKLSKIKKDGHYVLPDGVMVVKQSDVIFVCVNTPTNEDGVQDLSQIHSVIDIIVNGVNLSENHTVIVFRSTLLPKTNRKIYEMLCKKIKNDDWSYYNNPEFLTAKNALDDLINSDRTVIGGLTDDFKILETLYENSGTEIIKTGLEEAEMIKYVANNFLATKISYFNEMGIISSEMGLDVRTIERAVSMDRRIGIYGTRSGRKFGGMCFPKDSLAFNTEFPSDIITNTIKINNELDDN